MDFVYPRRGWGRGFSYLKHRLRRLPDTPEKIARGIFAGVFVCFTPLFGVHFFIAAFIAMILRGNIVASLLATFFGNPVTFPIIAVVSMKTGHFLLGEAYSAEESKTLYQNFKGAGADVKDNFLAIFSDRTADWSQLSQFYHDVYLPYLVGGLIPGIITGLVAYYMSVPVIAAYQKRRKGKLKKKLAQLRAKAAKAADEPAQSR
ncbi:DUF2062 domain-containing protein [Pseudoruegeria sp. SHC-113]|uniref:DUF2062 domain-containing protein n=1 Tax=Pseudoruegeria sp. SHC-113 TaxID=2855439 RepID=UPI0028E0A416|nr:DUF2062 domain-containing protein [Pseudoruegeria sp. SHC-113]